MSNKTLEDIESEIIDTFASISESLGYSEVHGKILAALLISDKALSLDQIANKTRYSSSMISLSLDLLEVIGMISKVKKSGDRKLYVKMDGDLLEALKTAVMLKLGKGFEDVSENLSTYRKKIKDMDKKPKKQKELLKGLKKLEQEAERIDKYIEKLSKVEISK
ncbi:MAG: hypothetical protein R6U26_04365 [Candidatus Undinarchaeales archaeon]